MSLTVSRGFADARRWTGVAAAVGEYLDASLRHISVDRIPRGAMAATKQFFEFVIGGIEIDQKTVPSKQIPPMAGICNLSIACDVLSSLPDEPFDVSDVAKIKKTIEGHLQTLVEIIHQIDERSSVDMVSSESRQQLLAFLKELMRQGLAEDEANDANEEHPGGLK